MNAARLQQRLHRPAGFSLIEMMVVVAIIVILVALAVPMLSAINRDADIRAARNMLRGILTSAKARATARQDYVAVRFQQDRQGRTFAVMLQHVRNAAFINYDGNGCPTKILPAGMTTYITPPSVPNCDFLVFVAASGTEPIALPRGIEIAAGSAYATAEDFVQNSKITQADEEFIDAEPRPQSWTDGALVPEMRDIRALNRKRLTDNTTFTIVFAPSGQIVRKRVFVGERLYDHSSGTKQLDTIYSLDPSAASGLVTDPRGLLYLTPDDDQTGGGGVPDDVELSEVSLVIYDRQPRVEAGQTPYTGYIRQNAQRIELNVYTGAVIEPPTTTS